jgi:hypothetical protein
MAGGKKVELSRTKRARLVTAKAKVDAARKALDAASKALASALATKPGDPQSGKSGVTGKSGG